MVVDVQDNKIEQPHNVEKVEQPTLVENQKVEEVAKENSESSTQEDPNWRAFREARKRDREERMAAERRAAEKEAEAAALKAAMEAAFAKENHQNVQRQGNSYDSGVEYDETEDQRIERKVQAALAIREEQLRKEQQRQEQQTFPQRLNKTYPDFEATVTESNLDYLEYHYPEIARVLNRHSEGFEKWSDIYLTVKRLVPNSANHKKDAARAENNFAKPKSISSTGLTQTSETRHILTDAQKAANWERMQRSLKGLV